MKPLPSHVQHYKSTPNFTEKTVPAGLLKNHNTKAGIWGMIRIEEGTMEYVIEGHDAFILSLDTPGVIEPEIMHHIKPLGHVLFHIEFYK